MIKHNQDGAASSILITLTLSVLLIAAVVLAAVAFSGRQHYKNDTQGLIDVAVKKATAQEDVVDNAQFAKQEQNPLSTYNGPEDYGSVVIKYPKTWSGYVDSAGSNGSNFTSYFNPGVVSPVSDQTSAFALSVQVLTQPYAQTVQGFQSQAGVTSSVYALPKVPKVVGVEVSGPLSQNQTDETIVVLPLRTDTLEILTSGSQYLDTFNSIILPNLSFSP